jgi:hypothetical protein
MANPSPSQFRPRDAGVALQPSAAAGGSSLVILVLAWAAVGLPLAWGVLQTLEKALALFK